MTVDEVMEEMMAMSSELSGPTGINPYVTKKLGKALGPYITLYFNKMIDYEDVPEINRFNFVAPLLKPGKPPEDLASYRPVSLTETWFRLLKGSLRSISPDTQKISNSYPNSSMVLWLVRARSRICWKIKNAY